MNVVLRFLARPLVLLHFVHYMWDVRGAPFPVDAPERHVAGPMPDRLLFIGDVAMAGYGVLHHGMAAPARTARLVSRRRSRGCRWETIATADLTAADVARRDTLAAAGVDAVVIMLGIPDVLLGTRVSKWARNLRKITARIAEEAGTQCPIVFAAIPPMTDFRPIPDPAGRLLTLQTLRLNLTLRRVAAELPRGVFVLFPKWRDGEQYVADALSWKAVHRRVARTLAPAIVQQLSADEPVSPIASRRGALPPSTGDTQTG